MPARVVLAMSGGVDSSVAAYLLKEQGYEVIGLFMRTGVHGAEPVAPSRKRGCCSAVDAGDARRVADMLDIPFYALDFEREFARVIDYFADEYLTGRTPNPCVMCNNWLKFGKLWSYGQQLDADFIATGHYARVLNGQLHQAVDTKKDQSYVLFGLQQEVLPRILFPIGGYQKHEVREIARNADLVTCDKPDSVEICFVPDGDHGEVIRRRRPEAISAGTFVDTDGQELAAHSGIENYTVGQRKGLGYAAGKRRYVLEIVPGINQVVLGDHEQLMSNELWASNVNWMIPTDVHSSIKCKAKIRYRHSPADATVSYQPNAKARVQFSEPQTAITPGQAVVFYSGSQVLGGGWIEKKTEPDH